MKYYHLTFMCFILKLMIALILICTDNQLLFSFNAMFILTGIYLSKDFKINFPAFEPFRMIFIMKLTSLKYMDLGHFDQKVQW